VKYSFQLQDGREAVVKFKHHGKRKGKAPKSTRCRIMAGGKVLSEAWARPAAEIAVVLQNEGRGLVPQTKLLRIVKTVDGRRVAIYKGDQFCREEGRSESFFKAIKIFSAKDRHTAALAMIGQGAVRARALIPPEQC